jgi:hypothetical protein
MSLNSKISAIRCELQNTKIKKSGKNKHAGFEYFELADFLPTLNDLMKKHGINDIVSFVQDEGKMFARLTLLDDEDYNEYQIPFHWFDTPLSNSGSKIMQDIQYLGAVNTYLKRYLYLNAFGITDGDVIDSLANKKEEPKKETSLEHAKKQLSNTCKIFDLGKKEIAKYFGLNSNSSAKDYMSASAHITSIGKEGMIDKISSEKSMTEYKIKDLQFEEVENEAI